MPRRVAASAVNSSEWWSHMFKVIKPLVAGSVFAALCLLTPGIVHAQSQNYCYNHPNDNSHYCFCYHHPKECNSGYRKRYPDWNRRPDWDHHSDADHHPEWYHQSDSDRGPGFENFANAGFDNDRHNDRIDLDRAE